MFKEKQNKQRRLIHRALSLGSAAAVAIVMAATAYASQNLVQDRRISLAQANAMADHARSVNSGFPIVVNDLVVKELNRYLGTPEGREFIRQSLQRLENYRTIVSTKIKQYHMPIELMAVPITEAGYQNLPRGPNKGWGAGLWMFIESTARAYGIRVDSKRDDRLDPELETDGAMRLLLANELRFGDWQLALMAYNSGDRQVQEAIDKVHSRNAWDLVRAGYENDKDYLARVMAGILIMQNPETAN